MEVVYVAHYLFGDLAASITTRQLVKALVKLGFEVTLIANDVKRGSLKLPKGVKVDTVIKLHPKLLNVPLIKVLRRTLFYIPLFLHLLGRSKGASLILVQHHNFHLATFTAALASKILRRPLIVKVHDLIPSSPSPHPLRKFYEEKLMYILNRLALRHARLVMVPSPELKFLANHYFNLRNVAVVPNAVEIENFKCLEEESCELLFVGNTKGRGLDKLILALPRIAREVPEVKVTIIGPSPDKRELLKLALKLGVADRVGFLGPLPHEEIPKLIAKAKVAIGPLLPTPYTYGAVPRKVLEYMACCKPVVAFKGTVSKELLVDGTTGVTVSGVDELALAVIKLLKDDELRRNLGLKAKEVVMERYSFKALLRSLAKCLISISKAQTKHYPQVPPV